MSENPYASYPAERRRMEAPGPEEFEGRQRVSVLAVLSLVFVAPCCVPLAPMLGAAMGMAALVGISAARGRLAGRTAAIIGVVLGVILTAGQVAIGVGVYSAFKAYQQYGVERAQDFSRALEAPGAPGVRGLLSQTAPVTDEEIARLGGVVRSELGTLVGVTRNPFEMAETFSNNPVFAQGGNSVTDLPQNAVPVSVEYSKGTAIFFVFFDGNPMDTGKAQPVDVMLILPDGRAMPLRGDGPASKLLRRWGLKEHPAASMPLGSPASPPAMPSAPAQPEAPAPTG